MAITKGILLIMIPGFYRVNKINLTISYINQARF